jgi:hypothetical protein
MQTPKGLTSTKMSASNKIEFIDPEPRMSDAAIHVRFPTIAFLKSFFFEAAYLHFESLKDTN